MTPVRRDEQGPALALDVGGTKLAAAVVAADGALLAVDRVPTPASKDAETIFSAVVDLLGRVHAAAGSPDLAGLGVGCGGPMRWPAGEVSPLNIGGWRGFPLRARLAELHPGLPVPLHNDAVCMAVAEHWVGAGRGLRSILGVVVSTGVGGGIIIDDRVVSGSSGNAGHVGHIVVEPDGPACGCGGRGCLEAVARGPAIVRWAAEHGCAAADGVALAAAARDGDPVATAAFARAGGALGIGLASALATLDVDAVVLGGGVSLTGELLLAPMRESLARHAAMGFTRSVPILPAGLGTHAGVVGAAALVLRSDRYWSTTPKRGQI